MAREVTLSRLFNNLLRSHFAEKDLTRFSVREQFARCVSKDSVLREMAQRLPWNGIAA